MIELINLTKKFNKNTAVDNINLTIKNGDFLGIIGQNGAGKSTTIKMITGNLIPDSGEILFNGKKINIDDIELKRNTFYIPQKPMFYEYLTAFEYLEFIANIYRIENYKEKIHHYLKLIDIESDKDRLLIEFSEGMIKKTVLIAGLLSNAKLLILDEVFAGLDPVAIYEFKILLTDFINKGNTIIFASHILESIEKLCSDVIIMKKGIIVEKLTKNDIVKITENKKSLEDYYIEKIK